MKKICILTLLILAFFVSGCSAETSDTSFINPNSQYCLAGTVPDVYVCTKTWTSYFDAPVTLKIYLTPNDELSLDEIFLEVGNTLKTYHELFDKYHSYSGVTNIYSINHRTEATMQLDESLIYAIGFALEHEKEIKIEEIALFNIALGPVLNIWHDARENVDCVDHDNYKQCPVPSDALADVDFPTNPDDILLDEETNTITFLTEGMELDLGGYGKGYVSEIISDYLDSIEASYILNTGESNLKAGGVNPQREDGLYYIGLREPSIESLFTSFYAYIKIPEGISVVSSGNYQRFFLGLDDNIVYHHIIDPRTNYPGGEAMSVTVFLEDGALADIYSTAIFLMTVSEGLDYVNSVDGLEAIWYLEDSTVRTSDNFESLYLFQYQN